MRTSLFKLKDREPHRSPFVETFAMDNRAEDIADYVSKTFGYEEQLAEIGDSRRRAIWIAGRAGPPPDSFISLMAFPLMDKCIEEARKTGFKTLWLGVWERNLRAQAFYKKYGFSECGTHIFQLGQDPQTNIVMSRRL